MKNNLRDTSVLTPTSAFAVLMAAAAYAPELVPFIVLRLFVGLTHSQAWRFRWEDASPDRKWIYCWYADGRRGRLLMPNASRWLERYGQPTGLVFTGSAYRLQAWLSGMFVLANVPRCTDILRRTFSYYWLRGPMGMRPSARDVGLPASTSITSLLRQISRDDVEAFWEILPPVSFTNALVVPAEGSRSSLASTPQSTKSERTQGFVSLAGVQSYFGTPLAAFSPPSISRSSKNNSL